MATAWDPTYTERIDVGDGDDQHAQLTLPDGETMLLNAANVRNLRLALERQERRLRK